ncbi:MAG: hypothetical protein DRJ03_02880 [Chloroflexi bacterium]|nr:MAG: hypothetical protein DRJ03_02880 [Chloroflexota bacterium]
MEKIADKEKIVDWAMSHFDSLQLYRACPDFEPDDNWVGSEKGKNGGEIHLIQQGEQHELYGETTYDFSEAHYLVTENYLFETKAKLVIEVLDLVFGDQCNNWPDAYAQTYGWSLC